jgi:hypothetical protein
MKITYEGREVETEEVEFEAESETFNTYLLADGNTLKVKICLIGVQRLKEIYDPMGRPVYTIQTGPVNVAAVVPKARS